MSLVIVGAYAVAADDVGAARACGAVKQMSTQEAGWISTAFS
jgi:hypothetical protein